MKENFIENESGNLCDIIYNFTYKLETYIGKLKKTLPENLSKLRENKISDEFLTFLLCESEDIIKNRIIKMSIDIFNTFNQKYTNVMNGIKGSDMNFKISSRCNDYIVNLCNGMKNLIQPDIERYDYTDKGKEKNIYEFKDYIDKRNKYISNMDFESSLISISKNDLMNKIVFIFGNMIDPLIILKESISVVFSLDSSVGLIKTMLDYLFMEYVYIKNIHIC